MCVICNGATHDELLFDLHGRIERDGWTAMHVEAGHDNPSWSYTIGLTESFDHPELVVVGLHPPDAAWLLGWVAARIDAGAGFEAGEHILMPGAGIDVLVGEVHPDQWTNDVFNTWLNYYGALGPPYPERRALQLILPAGRRGRRPHLAQPLLSEPDPVIHQPWPSRAERRARHRAMRGSP
jgi:hypothetical protein